ncbi:hypothetical protein BJX76DRAFT_52987 [Aspergillus varians]
MDRCSVDSMDLQQRSSTIICAKGSFTRNEGIGCCFIPPHQVGSTKYATSIPPKSRFIVCILPTAFIDLSSGDLRSLKFDNMLQFHLLPLNNEVNYLVFISLIERHIPLRNYLGQVSSSFSFGINCSISPSSVLGSIPCQGFQTKHNTYSNRISEIHSL